MLDGLGLDGAVVLEIGALHHPLAKATGAKVIYADHATTAELREKYAGHEDVTDIVEVDVVWPAGPLRPALEAHLGSGATVDAVVASHVIEHVPDLVGWFDELASVLAPGGLVALAIPDKRYCFDARRRESDVADIIEAHLVGRTRPTLAATFDFWTKYDEVDTAALWHGSPPPPPEPLRDHEALVRTREAAASNDYRDVHAWVFTPESFHAALGRLFALDLVPAFAVRTFRPTAVGHLEFHVVLERLADELDGEERRRLQAASLEAGLPATATHPAVAVAAISPRELRLIERKRQIGNAVRRFLPGRT